MGSIQKPIEPQPKVIYAFALIDNNFRVET
jgi:hypothetical protein